MPDHETEQRKREIGERERVPDHQRSNDNQIC